MMDDLIYYACKGLALKLIKINLPFQNGVIGIKHELNSFVKLVSMWECKNIKEKKWKVKDFVKKKVSI